MPCAGLLAALAGHAEAQEWTWQSIDLHPPGVYQSEAYAAAERLAGGWLYVGDDQDLKGPALWIAPVLDLVLLLPDGAVDGWVYGASDGLQVGHVLFASTRPALWLGTAESYIDLFPGGNYTSGVLEDVSGNQIAGRVGVGGNSHAGLWVLDEPVVFVDLHPAGALRSSALATDGVKQGGVARLSGSNVSTAAMWHGSPGSFVNMHPPVARDSAIWGMAPGVQVGKALIEDILRDHAILWHDTPESWIDMHPPQHDGKHSYLYATTGTMHVGRSNGRAGYWLGDDPASFYDLHVHAPPGALGSGAYDVAVHNGKVYIAGYGIFGTQSRAVVWIGTPIAEGGPPGQRAPSKATRWPP
ncbi:MAG: hypothetical protein AMXMBFR77_03370 [Phycisphaerales bacterium]|nr:MAG: hypothetical protein BroJett004_09580 [Planctomycetota bacterium]